MSEKYDVILADLKLRLGDQIWLTPKDLVPLLRKSEGAQAKMRSRGYIPPPAQPLGKSAGMTIYDLASWLAGELEVGQGKTSAVEAGSSVLRKTSRIKTKGKYDHNLSQWQTSVSYQLELITVIEALPLTVETEETAPKLPWEWELTFSPAELLDWRKQLYEQLEQIAQAERKLIQDELDGLEFLDRPHTSI